MLVDFEIVLMTALMMGGAGVIKGTIGFGLPLVAIALLTLVHPVESALAIISMPLIATNIKLALSGQNIWKTLVVHKLFILAMVLGTIVRVGTITLVNADVILVLLGGLVLFFSLLSVINIVAPLMNAGCFSEVGVGGAAGFFGGLTSSYGPLIALYLRARNLTKDDFVSTLCLIITIGALTFSLTMGVFRFYTAEDFLLSVFACIPAFIGLYFGGKIRRRIDTRRFFRLVLAMVSLIGIHLIFKGLHIAPFG